MKSQVKERISQSQSQTPSVEFSLDQVKDYWKKVAQQLSAEKGTSVAGFLESDISVDDDRITIFAPLALVDYIKGKRLFLLDFYKNTFANEDLNVVIEEKKLVIDEHTPMVASTREIFEDMVKRNPLLQVLKDKLQMDFEM